MKWRQAIYQEFKRIVIRVLKELSENYMKKDIETIKKSQSEMKNTINEMKNTLEGINSRLGEAEDRISDFEDKVAENTQSDQQKEKKNFLNKESLVDSWDNIRCNDIHIIGYQEKRASKGSRIYLRKY